MRLLNSTTLELEEFFDERDLKYAILSHTWGDGEVSFQDMQSGKASRKKGYAKIKMCCDQALKDGLKYAWVDTCCIDKTSSAELTESINSMYRWYQRSQVCYVYLSDVESSSILEDSNFRNSKWFTRGWTLQELIAPAHVEFFSLTWQKLGDKGELRKEICAVTGIEDVLYYDVPLKEFSIAKRMSWASKRKTTRVEDMAYCLLGIFEVNMPLLYGEGDRAFIRLQGEIMKISDDQSLFAWEMTDHGLWVHQGLLAESPAAFHSCTNIVHPERKLNRIPYSMTNMGLSIEMLMIPWAMETYLVALDCEVEYLYDSRVGIFLALLPEKDQYVRVLVKGLDSLTFKLELAAKSAYRKIYVRQQGLTFNTSSDKLYGFYVRSLPTKLVSIPTPGDGQAVSEVTCWNKWSDDKRVLKIPIGSHGTAGVISYKTESGYSVLKLGFDNSFNPICQLGGPLSTPTSQHTSSGGTSLASKMDPEWMLQEADWVFKGDRLSGLKEEQVPRRISIKRECVEINGKATYMWVVDIERIGARNAPKHDFICDGCSLSFFGTRHKCLVCPEFKYCSKCILTASDTHGAHEFQAVEV